MLQGLSEFANIYPLGLQPLGWPIGSAIKLLNFKNQPEIRSKNYEKITDEVEINKERHIVSIICQNLVGL